MKIKVSDTTNIQLDWLVAKCEGWLYQNTSVRDTFWICPGKPVKYSKCAPDYSTDWAQGGPIIERENIALRPHYVKGIDCVAYMALPDLFNNWKCTGKTPLIAAMRCYVVSKLGDKVEVPDELQ